MHIPVSGYVKGIAMIVDINEFELLVERGWDENPGLFVKDVLYGGIQAVEKNDGEVVAFMGDAFLAVLPTPEACGTACLEIARDVRKTCEYIADVQKDNPNAWQFVPGGVGLKIAIERGTMDVAKIESRFAGTQRLMVGPCVNYAARIAEAGAGNRCHLGPNVAADWPYAPLSRRLETSGKHAGRTYTYYAFDMSDVWGSSVDSGVST